MKDRDIDAYSVGRKRFKKFTIRNSRNSFKKSNKKRFFKIGLTPNPLLFPPDFF